MNDIFLKFGFKLLSAVDYAFELVFAHSAAPPGSSALPNFGGIAVGPKTQSARIFSLPTITIFAVLCVVGLVSLAAPGYAQCAGNAALTPVTATDETTSIPGSRQLVNGSGTTVNLTTPGQISIDVGTTSVATYVACNPQYTVPATPGEMVVFYGSSTKTVKILKLRLLTEQTTAGTNLVYLYRRNSAASGGTANAVTAVKMDSTDASPTATMSYYTANPTAGGSDGKILDGWDTQAPAAASNLQPNWQEIFNANYAGKPITLRGTSQGIGLNLNGVALPSGFKVQLQVIWTEE